MKFTAILLLTTAALAAAVPTNLQSNIEVTQHQSDAGSLIFQRGPGDDFDMKKKCKDIWHSDKTKHRDACASQSDEDSRNACMLRSLIGDASEKCKAAMVKALGF